MPAARARVPAADSPNARSAKSRQRHPPPRGLATALAFSRIVTPPPPRELPQGRDGLPTSGPTGPTRLSRTSSPCPTSRHRTLPAARFPGHPAHGYCRRPPRTPPDRPMPDLLPRVFVRSSPPASAASPTLGLRTSGIPCPDRCAGPIRLLRAGRLGWWSRPGSNRRPHACKARALPAELRPRRTAGGATLGPRASGSSAQDRPPDGPARASRGALRMVGQGGLEPPTSRLSSARSNQLSY